MNTFSEELVIGGSRELPISFDVTFNANKRNAPVAIFCHGFKGFKDWGAWNLAAKAMAEAGIFVIKMNFSHNGVVHNNLSDITDAKAFGENNFSTELDDLGLMLDWVTDENEEEYRHYLDSENITLIGHSRGAATVLLKTMEDDRVQQVVTWAGAFNMKKYVEMEDDAVWQERGYVEVTNGRTGDVYPIGYQFRQDFLDNTERLDLQAQIKNIDQSLLLIHGDNDEVAPISNSKKINAVVAHSLFLELEGDHVFGASHPWESDVMPEDLEDVVNETIEFIGL